MPISLGSVPVLFLCYVSTTTNDNTLLCLLLLGNANNLVDSHIPAVTLYYFSNINKYVKNKLNRFISVSSFHLDNI